MTQTQKRAVRDTLIVASVELETSIKDYISRGYALSAGLYAKRLVTCERAIYAVCGISFPEDETRN